MHLSPQWLRLLSVLRRWFCCCWLVVYCYPIVGFCNCSNFVYVFMSLLVLQSSWWGKRELVALLSLSSWCLMIVVWLFLAVPWVSLQFVIVVFSDHTHFFWLERAGTFVVVLYLNQWPVNFNLHFAEVHIGISIRYENTLFGFFFKCFIVKRILIAFNCFLSICQEISKWALQNLDKMLNTIKRKFQNVSYHCMGSTVVDLYWWSMPFEALFVGTCLFRKSGGIRVL